MKNLFKQLKKEFKQLMILILKLKLNKLNIIKTKFQELQESQGKPDKRYADLETQFNTAAYRDWETDRKSVV